MNAPIRWGLLSTARINRRLIPAIRSSRRSRLAAVASRSKDSADAYAKEWGIPLAFGSYEEMLSSDAIDAVYISLPNHLHAEWSIRALQAGKHVLCEKPFALNTQEVDRMLQAGLASGCVLMEAFMYRCHPQTRTVLQWVGSGRLGEVRDVFGVFTFKQSGGEDYRLNPAQGGGSLWDVGVYPISFAQAVYGSAPKKVFGKADLSPSGVDLTFRGLMEYPGGRTAQFLASFALPFHTRMSLFGTQGQIEIERPFIGMENTGYFSFTNAAGETQKVSYPQKELYLCEVEEMESAILEGKPTEVTLPQTRDHIRTVEALLASARAGQPVELA